MRAGYGRRVSVAEERYLAAIGRLHDAGERATVTALARSLAISKASVSEMLRRLETEGFVVRGPAGEATLAPAGEEAARTLAERHDVVERFLRDVLAVRPDDLPAEADRLASVVSPRLVERMRARLSALAPP